MKLLIDYPGIEDEKTMVTKVLSLSAGTELSLAGVETVLSPGEFTKIRNLVSSIRIDPVVTDYAVRLASATRNYPAMEIGAGPRGSLALIRCARSRALLRGRDFIIPDDIKALAVPALMHRITLSAESELEGQSEVRAVENLVSKIEAPRGAPPGDFSGTEYHP
jgi:MoxR-like ATPase